MVLPPKIIVDIPLFLLYTLCVTTSTTLHFEYNSLWIIFQYNSQRNFNYVILLKSLHNKFKEAIFMTDSELKDKYNKKYGKTRGENFRSLRTDIAKEKNLTKFSKLIGIAKERISELEKGDRQPSLYHILAYRNYFLQNYGMEISSDFFYGFTDLKENKNARFADDIGLSEDSINTLKKVKRNWDSKEREALNYVMKNSDLFLDFLTWLSVYIDNKYTIPLASDKEKGYFPCNNSFGNIALGKLMKDNKGNEGYKTIEISVDILESHAMIKMQKIIDIWKKLLNNERS